jgi:hypothetical protein
MNNALHNRSPFLQTQREFPNNIEALAKEVFRAYVDIAMKSNVKVIGTYAVNKPSITGESWFISSVPLQSQRQLYPIEDLTGPYPHGLDFSQIDSFSKIYGTATDDTNWYPIPYVSPTAAEQIQIVVDPTNIVLTGGGSAPTITSGYVVLEWLVRTSST